MSRGERRGFSAGRVGGWSMFSERLTTASTARVISLAYGAASCSRCCALMIREDAISSWARVILAVDWTLLIRRRTARSCAPMLAYTALLGVAGLAAGLGPDPPVGRRRRRGRAEGL